MEPMLEVILWGGGIILALAALAGSYHMYRKWQKSKPSSTKPVKEEESARDAGKESKKSDLKSRAKLWAAPIGGVVIIILAALIPGGLALLGFAGIAAIIVGSLGYGASSYAKFEKLGKIIAVLTVIVVVASVWRTTLLRNPDTYAEHRRHEAVSEAISNATAYHEAKQLYQASLETPNERKALDKLLAFGETPDERQEILDSAQVMKRRYLEEKSRSIAEASREGIKWKLRMVAHTVPTDSLAAPYSEIPVDLVTYSDTLILITWDRRCGFKKTQGVMKMDPSKRQTPGSWSQTVCKADNGRWWIEETDDPLVFTGILTNNKEEVFSITLLPRVRG